MTTLWRSFGFDSQLGSYELYRYGVNDSNSAAQVSTRLYTGAIPCDWRRSRTAFSLAPVASASSWSPNPARFSRRIVSGVSDSTPPPATVCLIS